MIEPGAIINERFRVIKLIGEGGMGAVFEGEHTGVGRKVAIKVLHPSFARNAEIVGRFQREARSAAAIGHDNIIEIMDFGTHDGAPYMVMEYLKGQSLRERLDERGTLPFGDAAYIMTQVLSALGAAHASDIIHRDLKPDNVFLITKAGHRDFVKLLDFGIAKLRGDDKPENKGLTQTGAVMGTPYYMSPEQALGKRDIDHRADLYSAGVMLYQMVTGQVPFDGESQAELLMMIVYRMNGLKRAREIVPGIPEEYDNIIVRSLEKERELRFGSAQEFAQALVPFVTAPKVSWAPNSTGAPRSNPIPTPTPNLTPLNWEKGVAATMPSQPRVDVPKAMTAAGAIAPLAQPEAVAKPKSRTGLFATVGVAALVAAGIGVFALKGSSRPAATQAAAQPPAVPVTPTMSANVTIDLDGLPAGAAITVDDAPSASPHLTLPRGSSHAIRVTAPGRLPYSATVTADRDRSIMIALAEQPAAPPVALAPVVPTVPTAPPGSHGRPPNVAARVTAPVGGQVARANTTAPPVVPRETPRVRPPPTGTGARLQVNSEF